MTAMTNYTGKRFGRLVAVSFERRKSGSRYRIFWVCRCDCGQTTSVVNDALKSGDTQSCGCMQKEKARARRTSHGQSRTRLYRIWEGIKTRCLSDTSPAFHNYGGRGISICERWREDFSAFAADVGDPPTTSHTIDRYPNNDGNYEPGNVRWATRQEQGRNRRGLNEIEFNGQLMCLAEVAEHVDVPYKTLAQRIVKLGWSIEDALSIPPVVGQKHLGLRKPSAFRHPKLRRKMNGEVVLR